MLTRQTNGETLNLHGLKAAVSGLTACSRSANDSAKGKPICGAFSLALWSGGGGESQGSPLALWRSVNLPSSDHQFDSEWSDSNQGAKTMSINTIEKAALELPFIDPKKGDYWCVRASHNSDYACELGIKYANLLIDYMRRTKNDYLVFQVLKAIEQKGDIGDKGGWCRAYFKLQLTKAIMGAA